MARLVIIADDLTGALDCACAFALRGLATRVVLQRGELASTMSDPLVDVVAYPTGTRELPAGEAERIVADTVAIIKHFNGIIFKKIDSRLKGNIAIELGVIHAAFPRPVFAAPTIPAQGRYVRGGAVVGAAVAQPIEIAPVLGLPAETPDCMSQAEMDAALPAELLANLYVGAAGLAVALARRMSDVEASRPIDLAAPLLIAIGSRDPVTLAQIAAAPLDPIAAPNGEVPVIDPGHHTLVQLVQGADAIDTATAAKRFAAGIVEAFRLDPVQSLFACGGETAHAILLGLEIAVLDVLGEVLPGVPVARCPKRNLTVLTKSGGFGGPDLLRTLIQKFDKSIR